MKPLAILGIGAAALAVVGGAVLLSQHGPTDPVSLGEARQQAGDLAGARAIWDAACNATPADSAACVSAATSRLLNGKVDEARPFVERASLADPTGLRVLLLEAGLARADGDDARAVALYAQAEQEHPESGLPAANEGMMALADKDLAAAERCAARALAADPKLAMAHALQARVLSLQGQDEPAEQEYRTAIELAPNAYDERLELADLLSAGERWEERAELLGEALRIHANADLELAYGQALARAGRDDDAIAALRAAADDAPTLPDPQLELGNVFLERGSSDFAAARYRAALALAPADPRAELGLAKSLYQGSHEEEAMEPLNAMLLGTALTPSLKVEALYLRARCEARSNADRKPAIADLEALLSIDPKHEDANWLEGHLLLDAKRYDEARPHLEIASTVDEPGPDALLDHARILAHDGKLERAMEELRRLDERGDLDPQMVRVQPEFVALADRADYRLLLERTHDGG